MKILFNACHGGFEFSEAFVEEFNRRVPEDAIKETWHHPMYREHPVAITLLEEWGTDRSSASYAQLKIKEIPDGAQYEVRESSHGRESIVWSFPKETIIYELIDIIKRRKTSEEVSKLTQLLLSEDKPITWVRQYVLGNYS